MLLEDHKRRVARLLRGERKIDDLHRLFSDLRLHRPGRTSVQEIGHFAAHRDERDTGITLERANNIQVSTKLWYSQLNGVKPTAEHLEQAGRANLKIMPDQRIREQFGISRQTAEQSFNKAIRKFRENRPLKEREIHLLKVFGLSLMWQFAFNDKTLWRDFVDLLVKEGSLEEDSSLAFEPVSIFLSLYALNIMHGARLKMADGKMTRLRLAASEEGDFLRIKAEIPVSEVPKPISISVSMFETALKAEQYCDRKLLTIVDDVIPAEIEGSRLVALA
ncbi:hypothetical protein [Methylorubrum sp. POS3]|uniref:hypothetical protein n=1 Tax=Methylorubrum sp. POS3 TaxID=2998492 RepID=UPI00372BD32F